MNGSQDFIDLRTRAEFLELCGDAEGARRLEEASFEIAREVDLVCYAYQLMWRDRVQDAIDLLGHTIAQFPDSWNAYHSLGEAYEQAGDYAAAIASYRNAQGRAELETDRSMVGRRLAGLTDLATAC